MCACVDPAAAAKTAAVVDSTSGSSSEGMSLGELFSLWWKFIMTALLLAFFVSCISHFAQYYQMTLDQEDSNKLRRRLPNSVRLELASPTSGRLKLPPPTPVTAAAAASKALLREAPHTAIKIQPTFLFPKTPAGKTPASKTPAKTPAAATMHTLREMQLSDSNPMTPEAVSSAAGSRKRE